MPTARLFIWHVDLTSIDGIDNVVWRPAVYCAAYGLRSPQDLLDASRKVLRQRLELHSPCNLNNLIERNVSRVLDVFLLFPIPRGLCGAHPDVRSGAKVTRKVNVPFSARITREEAEGTTATWA
jgi:hypothetical protein